MSLNAGNTTASQGLANDIYAVLDANLRPPLEQSLDDPAEQLPPIQDAWRLLSFCIASGVVEHLRRDPASEPEYAEVFSSSAQDAAFWAFFGGLAGALRSWASGAGSVTELRTSLDSFFDANATPTQLRGVLR